MSGFSRRSDLQNDIVAAESKLAQLEKSTARNSMLAAATAAHLSRLRAQLAALDLMTSKSTFPLQSVDQMLTAMGTTREELLASVEGKTFVLPNPDENSGPRLQ